jgi:hypothetical protein
VGVFFLRGQPPRPVSGDLAALLIGEIRKLAAQAR